MRETIAIVALATLACGHLSVARGATDTQKRTETVKFADLDVTTERGADRLYQRLSTAANHVCRDLGDGPLTVTRSERLACESQAVGSAVGIIDTPAVTTVAHAHGVEPLSAPAGR